MSDVLGWSGNVVLITGLLLIGRRYRHAFAWTVAGEVIWLIESIRLARVDMAFLCLVFAAIAAYNWRLWVKGVHDDSGNIE